MPNFSNNSKTKLATCDPRLQAVFNRVVEIVDCTIVEGHRNKQRQNEMFDTGKSQVQWPNGKHNSEPSHAADVIAYPIDWKDRERATLFAGYVMGAANEIARAEANGGKPTWRLRWGGDWDSDWQVKDNSFDDLVHFEIVEL